MIKQSLYHWLKYLLAPVFFIALVTPADAGKITDVIQGKLVKIDSGRELKAHTIGSEPPIYVFVFSASWCSPCNEMMPGLISKYKALKKINPNGFEFILVSADNSAADMKNYMVSKAIPWPALTYDQRDAAAAVKAVNGEGIPSLVIMTKDGRFIDGSYKNKGSGDYQGVDPVVASLENILGSSGGASTKSVESAAENAAEAADAAAEKLGISSTRLWVGVIMAAGTFLFLFFKN